MSLRLGKPLIASDAPQATRSTLPCGSAVTSLRDEHSSVDSRRFAALFSRLGQPVEALWPLDRSILGAHGAPAVGERAVQSR